MSSAESHKPDSGTEMEQSVGSKQIKAQNLPSIGTPADVGKAPPMRIYSRDYSKVSPEPNDGDLIGPVLGNPLRW